MKLIFVKLLGKTATNEYVYEFLFDESESFIFDTESTNLPLGLTNFEIIDLGYIKKKLVTNVKFDLIQESMCHNFKQCVDGCVSVCYENIDAYSEYPEDGRLVFQYGETYEEIERKLNAKYLEFEE